MNINVHIEVQTATGCAWRAVYLCFNGRQIAHLGVDPHDGVRPEVFGSLGGRSFALELPYLPWKQTNSDLYLKGYRLSQAFWRGVDGRFGWGTHNVK